MPAPGRRDEFAVAGLTRESEAVDRVASRLELLVSGELEGSDGVRIGATTGWSLARAPGDGSSVRICEAARRPSSVLPGGIRMSMIATSGLCARTFGSPPFALRAVRLRREP